MLTKHPLLAETVISAETASFGQKTCFGLITEIGESRKAEIETCFGRNFRPKPNRNSIRLTTSLDELLNHPMKYPRKHPTKEPFYTV